MFDIGILGAMSDLSPKTILDYDYGSYKGYFAENFVSQEFLTAGWSHLYSWHEGKSELEFVLEQDGKLIPIEVNSGWVTQSKSLKIFAQKYNPSLQIILSANNIMIDKNLYVYRYPLYLASAVNKFK